MPPVVTLSPKKIVTQFETDAADLIICEPVKNLGSQLYGPLQAVFALGPPSALGMEVSRPAQVFVAVQ